MCQVTSIFYIEFIRIQFEKEEASEIKIKKVNMKQTNKYVFKCALHQKNWVNANQDESLFALHCRFL